jgi:hypothetical protein
LTVTPAQEAVPVFQPISEKYRLASLHLTDSTIAVWSNGKGDYFDEMLSRLLTRAFPEAGRIIWTHARDVLLGHNTFPVGVLSFFLDEQNQPFPTDLPVITWSEEPRQLLFQGRAELVAEIGTRLDIMHPNAGSFYLPQVLLRSVTEPVPHSLRLYDDDVAKRPYAVAYINHHCTKKREGLFAALLRLLGPAQAKARSICSRNDPVSVPGTWYNDTLIQAMSEFKLVIAMESCDYPGYVTEKIVNAFLAGAVPIVWGARETVNFLFNPKAFVSLHDYGSLEEAAADIAALAFDDVRLTRMRNEAVSTRLDWLNEKLRWKENNASGYESEATLLRSRLLNHWSQRIVPE